MENLETKMGELMAQVAEPMLIRRARGGWLAVSMPQCSLKIGVTAASEGEARASFERALQEWMAILSGLTIIQLDAASSRTTPPISELL